MHVALLGLGTTGSFVARQLRAPAVTAIQLYDVKPQRYDLVGPAVDTTVPHAFGLPKDDHHYDVAILATPVGTHLDRARSLLVGGTHVVSLSEDPAEIRQLLELDGLARQRGLSLVVGAGFEPGLSCLLVKHAASALDTIETISVSKAGTGGPACARQHHRALKTEGSEWLDGEWWNRRGGSGRDLAWFPDPIGARDCYKGGLASPHLLHLAFPEAGRITARLAANRRARFTSGLPMLRSPHEDGGPGAVRAELRGTKAGAIETVVYGSVDHPSVAAATVAVVAALGCVQGQAPVGAGGLAEWDDHKAFLRQLHKRGVKIAGFVGVLEA